MTQLSIYSWGEAWYWTIKDKSQRVDIYLNHKVLNIEYLSNLKERLNDLHQVYEFARDNELNRNEVWLKNPPLELMS